MSGRIDREAARLLLGRQAADRRKFSRPRLDPEAGQRAARPLASLGSLTNFAINAEIAMTEKIKVVVNHAATPSPLVQTNSFLLDLDMAIEQALPTSEKALWEAIEGLRSAKYTVFEACITDRTRELFS